MMYEIEIKSAVKDPVKMEALILDKGGSFVRELTEADTYYNHPSRDFSETGEAFRIRKAGSESCVTYKGPVLQGEAKIRHEEECPISDPDVMMRIIDLLGFRCAGNVKKVRREFTYIGCTVVIDRVEGLGSFIEIEKIGDDRTHLEQEVLTVAGTLGADAIETRSYLEMVLAAG